VTTSSALEIKLYIHAGMVNALADVVGYCTNSSLQQLAAGTAPVTGQVTLNSTIGVSQLRPTRGETYFG